MTVRKLFAVPAVPPAIALTLLLLADAGHGGPAAARPATAPAAAVHPLASRADTVAVQAAIDAGNALYIETWKNENADGYAQLFDTDGAKLGGRTILRGRPAIAESMKSFFKLARLQGGTITTRRMWLVDDLAYETGKFVFQLAEPGKTAESDSGHYVTIWRRQADGSWKIYRDMGVPEN